MAITAYPNGTGILTPPDGPLPDTPHAIRHPDGTVSVGVHDFGAHLTITAGPGATPALLRVAFNAMRTELMPGRTEGDNA